MVNRTIQFFGYAYGDVPVQLSAQINGQTVFSGAVETVNQTIPSGQIDMSAAPVLFSVENSPLFPVEFSGSYPMTVTVETGYGVALNQTFANYMLGFDPVANVSIAGNATGFLDCFVGTNSEGNNDSRSGVTIDGVVAPRIYTPDPALGKGEWTWVVNQGSVISYNFNVSVGNVAA
jgi:hypothetical protein